MMTYREMTDNVLRRAKEYEEKRRRRRSMLLAALPVVCVCLAAAALLWRGSAVSEQTPDAALSGQPQVVQPSGGEEMKGASAHGGGISIPAIELPEPREGVVYDMIGLVVYKGGIYTQAESYYGEEAEAMQSLVGERLGRASGSIDEWSTQDEYAEEFASTYEGDVYSVKGYDEDFRLCVCQYIESDGGRMRWIQFLERLNGIELTCGADLFEDRLRIGGRISSVQYQSHEDWNMGRNAFYDLEDMQALEPFLAELDAGEFENLWLTDRDFYRSGANAHLYLRLEDGTTVELRLAEGGYAGYQHLGWYFVKMPGAAFDAVFEACR